MHVAIAQLSFHLPSNGSLKGKRQAAQALATRLRGRFNVAVAEVEAQEAHQRLVLGVATVSGSAGHADEQMDAAIRYAAGLRVDAELVDVQRTLTDGT
ncbi:MAG: DUF503 domain-containing protein [Chloroflexota bacterium]